jgi:P4 family phage/plasmid primase-like protien
MGAYFAKGGRMSANVVDLDKLRQINAASESSADAETVGVSEDVLAERFTERHRDNLRYVAAWDRWMVWGGQAWHKDERKRVFDLARKICRDVLGERLNNEAMTEAQERTLRQRLGSAATIWAIVKLAATSPVHALLPSDLDPDPWALNTPGGLVDLKSGATRPHDPTALCTKITSAAPAGSCPLFLRVLERALPDAEVRGYVQRIAGYALTGLSREHVLSFWFGSGRNSKGTIAHAVRRALGDYGLEVPAELLTESHNERHPCELAVLHGARFVIGSEIDTGKRWNESRLKRLTGGDPISARFIGKDPFEFEPSHTLVILANNKPGLRAVDEAMRARLHLVPFDVVIPEGERDTALSEKLAAEYGGILAWALEGCLEWQKQGLAPPEAIRAASRNYLDGEDNIGAWLTECCDRTGVIKLTAAHKNYRDWTERSGVPPLGRNAFGDQLATHGVTRQTNPRSGVIEFHGLSMKPAEVSYGSHRE